MNEWMELVTSNNNDNNEMKGKRNGIGMK